MKQSNFFLALVLTLALNVSYAQVGIGTTTPKTTLQVEGNPANTTTADGIQGPLLSLAELDAKIAAYGADQDGAIVYIDDVTNASTTTETANITATGYFYYDAPNGVFKKMGDQYIQKLYASAVGDTLFTSKANWVIIPGISLANLREPNIGSLICSNVINSGTLTEGAAASEVSSTISYTDGNGGIYQQQTFPSTGVIGLTATLAPGTLANGNGTLTYSISGYPSISGTASFALNIGGQSCTLAINVVAYVPVYCGSGATTVVDVTNPSTGKTWMDRNLGAARVAQSQSDEAAAGDLYQWGRRNDGHQCRNSATTQTQSSIDAPLHGDFVVWQVDWRDPINNNLWQGVNGINNPCPSGYRVPTKVEWEEEIKSLSQRTAPGAFASPLKLPRTSYRDWDRFGTVLSYNVNSVGHYWTSTVVPTKIIGTSYIDYAHRVVTSNSVAEMRTDGPRTEGNAIRCIKD